MLFHRPRQLEQPRRLPEIEEPVERKFFRSGNPYSYILGRKGTGKTRLLKEMAQRGLGLPLLVAADETTAGALRSQSIEATEWLKRCDFDASIFWWSLLTIAIENSINTNKRLGEAITQHITENSNPNLLSDRLQIKNQIANISTPLTFLVDGLETLVPTAKIKELVSSLFHLMGTVQNDPLPTSRPNIKTFVREDLAADSVQNIEQQMEGRNLRLKWSATSILNFAISRLPTLPWIRNQFQRVCEQISKLQSDIGRGALSEQEATEILLHIFPTRVRRNNLSTATFLRLYFSDAGGDDTIKATFYPRLYLSFLQRLDKLAASSPTPLDQDGRIDSSILNQAYDEASSDFINETKQELSHLLRLDYVNKETETEGDNVKVSKFIAAFAGLSTPFPHEAIILELCGRTNFTENSIRESLQKMKGLRMFEDRPGYAGWWRVGQLYKMGCL